MVVGVDLYGEAQRFGRGLRGKGTVLVTSELPTTKSATHWRASQRRIIRVFRGCYIVGATPPDLLDRCRAVRAVTSPPAVIGYHTAAALHGFGVVESDDVHLVVPAGAPFPQRRGIVAHQSVLPVRSPAVVHDVLCTPPARTAIDLARLLPRSRALAVLDAALNSWACTSADLASEVMLHKGLRGYLTALKLVPLADGRSECAQESHLRLIIHDAGLQGFEPQVQVLNRFGRVLYRLDLADRRHKVAAEYDGVSHLDKGRMRIDRRRHNRLSDGHWRLRYFTDIEIYQRPDDVVSTLKAAIADALADPRVTPQRHAPTQRSRAQDRDQRSKHGPEP